MDRPLRSFTRRATGALVHPTVLVSHFTRARRNAPPFVRNRWVWVLRQVLAPAVRLRCQVQHFNGTKFILSDDPLDDVILRGLFLTYSDLFFPSGVTGIGPDDWILDVGAHHGFYAVEALRRYPGKLIAIEPDPVGVRLIRENLFINSFTERAETIEGAVGNRDGEGLLERSEEGSWGNRIVGAPDARPVVRVRTYRLESVLKGRAPSIVKCNCEGGEFSVIPQLFALGLRPACIILLVHPSEGDESALLNSVREHGYGIEPVRSTATHPRYVCRLGEGGTGDGAGGRGALRSFHR